jgi:hypothetical protein
MSDQNNSNSGQNIFLKKTTSKGNSVAKSTDDESEKRVGKDPRTQDSIEKVLRLGKDIPTWENPCFLEILYYDMIQTPEVSTLDSLDIEIKNLENSILVTPEVSTLDSLDIEIKNLENSIFIATKNTTKGENNHITLIPCLTIVVTVLCAVGTIWRDQQKSIDERFLKTVELIGHNDHNVRSGAIIAVKQVFQDSPNKTQESVELLANLARINSPFFAKRSITKVVPSDVTMALKVIKEAN